MALVTYSKKIMTSNWLDENFKPKVEWGYCPKSFTIIMNIDDGFNGKKYKGEFKYIFDSIDTTTNYVVYKMSEKNYLYRMDASEVINANNTSFMRDNLNLSTLYLPINDMTLRVGNLCRVVNGNYIPLYQSHNGISVESIEVTNQSGVLYDCIFSGSEFGGNYINNNKFDSSSLLPNYNGTDNKAVTYKEYGNIFNIATDSSKCITESTRINITWYPIIGNVCSSTLDSTKGCFKRSNLLNDIKIMPPSISGWKEVVSDNDNFLSLDNNSYYYFNSDPNNKSINLINKSISYGIDSISESGDYAFGNYFYYTNNAKRDPSVYYDTSNLFQLSESKFDDNYIYEGCYLNKNNQSIKSLKNDTYEIYQGDLYANRKPHIIPSITKADIDNKYKHIYKNVVNYLDCSTAVEIYSHPTLYNTYLTNVSRKYDDILVKPNEIWYTSTNGGIITPTTTYWGVTITSNTYENGIGKIVFNTNIDKIGYQSFANKGNLKSIIIPEGVTLIDVEAFYYCYSLTDITIPDSVTTIGARAFRNCTSLTSVTIPDSVTSIGGYAFYDCSSLTSVTIPDSVTEIGTYALASCDNLTSVTIGDSVTTIGTYAFYYCTNLKSVYCKALTPPTIDESVFLSIHTNNKIYVPYASLSAYQTATGWKNKAPKAIEASSYNKIIYTTTDGNSINHIKGIDYFDANIISNEYDKENSRGVIIFDSDVTKIDASAFYGCSNLKSIIIPGSVTTIGNNAFNMCVNLTSVTIPDSVTSIGTGAFGSCLSLTSIKIPNSVRTIGSSAFYQCESLTSVTIPDSVTSIGVSAFEACNNLTSVTIGAGISTIGNYAFRNCSKLSTIYCNRTTTVPIAGTTIFNGCSSLSYIYVNNDIVATYKAATGWKTYSSKIRYGGTYITYTTYDSSKLDCLESAFDVGILNHSYDTASNTGRIMFDGELKTIGESAFGGCATLTSITIPSGVNEIGVAAFNNCFGLESVTIPNSVTTIGGGAFQNCYNLESVNIPNGVKVIGNLAFYDCRSIRSVTIPDSVTEIGERAFSGCIGISSLTIHSGVKSIISGAFYGCTSITSVIIPDSVTTIGLGAFQECSSLTSVTIGDSATSIGECAFWDCSNLTVVNCYSTIIPKIGIDAFPTNVNSIRVNKNLVEKYKLADGWVDYSSKIYSNTPTGYSFIYTTNDNKSLSGIIGQYYNKYQNKGIINTRSMYNGMFKNKFNLTSITNLDGITSIPKNAFYGCTNLKSIIIPSTVEEIGDYAFYGCRSLEYVIFKSETPCKIGKGAFSNTNIKVIYVPNNSYDNYRPFEIKEDENGNAIIPIVSVPSIFEQDNTISTKFNLKEYAYCTPHTKLKKQVNVSQFETLGISINNDNVNDVLIDKFGKLKGVYRVYGSYTDASNVDRSFDTIVDESCSNDDTFGNITYKLDSSGNIYCNFNFEEPSYVNEYCVDLIGVHMEDKAKAQILFGMQSDTYKDWNSLPLKVYQKLTPGIEGEPPTDSASLTNVIGDFDNE